MKYNSRISSIAEYHFRKLDYIKNIFQEQGIKITDLSIGDPDLQVDKSILEALVADFSNSGFNNYPPYEGMRDLKEAVIKYYRDRFLVDINYDEVIILIGSKEGLNNIIPASCGIGDYAIIPSPAYPVYETCCKLWGVNTYKIELKEKDMYLPNLNSIPSKILDKSNLMIINYPNNPTGAVGNADFFKEIVEFAYENNILVCNDGAYNEILDVDVKPISILQFDTEKKCIEIGSFSKIYNMTGFRIGYAVGNSRAISALLKVKSNVDSGQFKPIQKAAEAALKLDIDYINRIRNIYSERKAAAEMLLDEHNIQYFNSAGTFYLWCKAPYGYSNIEFCEELLKEYGIVVTPGSIFDVDDSTHFRISLTRDKNEIINCFKSLKSYK
ncbi:aminotransferase class I/II-fold pyridoxal phosphate-dependent enzyme [Clostridium omnivorum]|uniref:Aminotransferase n=1 Tax=Clostridium omnivorum TaxID=1604902 RepID=A0ABQ5NCP1_9CLOT|nr:aminotransferase class I/II-fold pyridoxal phosphate-dependent enzyme [Clostridium sp. E14]GLC32770.1 aminotransferase [Clostridium sp. E14]